MRRRRDDAADPKTDQHVNDLIARAGKLLDELHAIFDNIKMTLQKDEAEEGEVP